MRSARDLGHAVDRVDPVERGIGASLEQAALDDVDRGREVLAEHPLITAPGQMVASSSAPVITTRLTPTSRAAARMRSASSRAGRTNSLPRLGLLDCSGEATCSTAVQPLQASRQPVPWLRSAAQKLSRSPVSARRLTAARTSPSRARLRTAVRTRAPSFRSCAVPPCACIAASCAANAIGANVMRSAVFPNYSLGTSEESEQLSAIDHMAPLAILQVSREFLFVARLSFGQRYDPAL